MKKRSTTPPDNNEIQQKTGENPPSSRHLQQLFDEMTNGFALHEIICDAHGKPVDYRFLQMNAAFERLTGLVAGEVVGKTAREVLPGLEPFWIETYGRVALTGQPERFENYTQALDKIFSVVAYCPEHGKCATLFEDVTRRRQVEQELLRRNEDLDLLNAINNALNNTESLETVFDLISEKVKVIFKSFGSTVNLVNAGHTHLVMQNLTIPAWLLKSIEKLTGIHIPAIQHDLQSAHPYRQVFNTGRSQLITDPEGIQEFIKGFIACLNVTQKTRTRLEALIPSISKLVDRRSVMVVPLVSNNVIIGTLDIGSSDLYTEEDLLRLEAIAAGLTTVILRKQAEQKLKESAVNMQAMLDADLDAVFLIEPDGTILAANLGLSNRFGRNRDELIGSNTYDLVPQEVADHRRKFMDQVITSGKPLLFEDQRAGLTIENSIYPVLDEQGKVVRLAVFGHDITERRKAEEQIRRSESELKKAQAYAHVGSWIWDIRSGKLEWSDEMYNIFGISKENFSGNLQEVVASAIHPDDRQNVEASNTSVANTGKPIPLEYRILLPDGNQRVVWAEAGELEKDAEGNPALLRGIVMDITERKQAENALRESEKHLKNSQQIAHLGSWQLDVATNQVLWTEELYHMYGFDPALPVPPYSEHMKLFTPASWEKLSASLADTRETGIPYVLELETVKKDGGNGWMWVRGEVTKDSGGNTIGLWGAAQDITERKQAEEALMAERNFARQIMNSMGQGLTVTDEQGRFEYVNPVYAKMVGYDPKDLLGLSPQEMSTPESQLVLQNARNSRQLGETTTYEIDLKHSAGHLVPVMVTGVPRQDAGEITGTIAVITDLTERKQAEGEIRRMAQMLDIAPNSITVHDLDGQFLFANQKTFDLHGYTRTEFMDLNLHHLDLPESEALIAKRMQDILERGDATFEVRHYHKDGSILPMEVHARLTSWDDQKVLLSIATDIRERKQAEDALQKSRDLLNTTGKMAKVGGWEIDSSGNTLAWTEETFHIHELAAGSQPDVSNALNFYHPDDRVRVASAVEQAITTGQPFDFEARLITALGNQIWVRSSGQAISQQGKITGIRGSIQDITERKLAEEALQESEQRYRERAAELETIMDIAPVALWIAQDSSCHVIIGNRTANQLHRIKPDQNASMTPVEGQKPHPNQIRILHNGVEITPAELPLQVSASQGIEIRDFESQIVFDDGEVVHEIGNAKPLFDKNGQSRGAVGTFMDITGLKQVEEELRRRAEVLDGLQKTVLDITAAQNLPGLLESIVERACQLLGAPGGGLYTNDIEKEEVRCDVSYNTPINYAGVVLKYGEGVAGRVAQTGEPLYIEGYKNWTGRAQSSGLDRPFSIVLGVPLLWGGQVRGVIDVLHFEDGKSFSRDDIELLNIFAGHAAIAIENSRLLEASQAGQVEVRALSTRLAEAEENERRRIARELHDQVGQSLSALSINMNIMHSQVPEFLPGFKRRLDDSLMLIDQTTDHIRHLMSELRPAVLDDYGLKAALDWAVGSIAKRTNLKLLVEGECNRFPPRIEIALFRIAQEALGNISRHARARNVKILLTQDGAEMSMSVTDDGIGFDPSNVAATEKSGWGLRLMAERAESIGASLQVESTPGKGTCITARYHDDNSTGG